MGLESFPLQSEGGTQVGPVGPQGDPGPTGPAGTGWIAGAGAPASGTGVVGDLYLNTATNDFYEKTDATTWTQRGTLGSTGGGGGGGGGVGDVEYLFATAV